MTADNHPARLAALRQPYNLCITGLTLKPDDMSLLRYDSLSILELRRVSVPTKALQKRFVGRLGEVASLRMLTVGSETKLDCGILSRKILRSGFVYLKTLHLVQNHFESAWMPLLSRALPHVPSLDDFKFYRVPNINFRYLWLFRAVGNLEYFYVSSTREFLPEEFIVLSQVLERTEQMAKLDLWHFLRELSYFCSVRNKRFATAIERNSSLTTINVFPKPTSLASLRDYMPEL